MSVRRFISAYHWELLLLVVVPAVSGFASQVGTWSLWVFADSGSIDSRHGYYNPGVAAGSLAAALVLALAYARVRGARPGYLTQVWGYALAFHIVNALSWGLATVVAPVDPNLSSASAYVLSLSGVALATELAQLPVVLVFARRASRISLSHAFFLYLVFQGYGLPYFVTDISLTDSRALDGLLWLVASMIWSLIVGCVLAWLLGNFERRGDAFRKRAYMALFAARLVWLLSPLMAAVHLFYMALIYLTRDRRTAERPPADTSTAVSPTV